MVTFEIDRNVEVCEFLGMSGVSPCDVGSQIAVVTLCGRAEQVCFSKVKLKTVIFAEKELFTSLVTRDKTMRWLTSRK